LTLALASKKNMNIFNATTDSIGQFKFENIMFSGKTNMYLNSRTVKGKFRGEIIVDSIGQPPIQVSFKNEPIIWSETTSSVVDKVFKKYAAFGVKPENILEEVTIVAKKKIKSAIHLGIPEFSYVANEETSSFTNIYELIQQNVPGVIPYEDVVRFSRYDTVPIFVLNGNTYKAFKEEVDIIRPQDVEKIDIIKGIGATAFFGEEGANGIIAIYTKPNTGNQANKEVFHSIKQVIDGFYTARVFYVPDPEKIQLEANNEAAVRNTLYWNPNVLPDKTGNASVNYYNTKVETKVKVALEGITATGIPVVKNTFYTIKK